MNEQQCMAELPVDLTREEFVEYNMLLSRISGAMRLRFVRIAGLMLLSIFSLAAALYTYLGDRSVDWFNFILGGALLLISGFIWFFTPYRVRRQAEKAYDETLAGGYTYYGMLRVYDDRVEKSGAEMTAVVPIDRRTVFMEDKKMMVFMGADRRAIVLPARCMTPEAAIATRQAADLLQPGNRRFRGRLQPQSRPVTPPPPTERPVLWERQLRYTVEEYVAMANHQVMQNYWRALPWLGAISAMIGFTFGCTQDTMSLLPCILYFLAAFGLLTVMNLVLPRRQIARTAGLLAEDTPTLWVRFTDAGVLAQDVRGFVCFPWSAAEHVIDRDAYVEIIHHQSFMWIPKRCIDDFAAFDEMISAHWRKK